MASSTKAAAPETADKTPQTENRNDWVWGFSPQAELWNGRLAMVGFVSAFVIEMLFGKGILHF